jgi:hypothetical protein
MLLLGSAQAASGQPGGWTDAREFGPFVCRSEFPLAEVQPLLEELGQLQADLVETLRIPPAEERVEVYFFRGKATYKQFLAAHFPKVGYRRALYVKDGGPGMVMAYRNPEFGNDLRHECTHALLHAVLPAVPLWLDEGLAKYFEVQRASRAYGHPYLSSLPWTVRLLGLSSVEDLERRSSVSEMGTSEYRAAWAWVHFLLHGSAEGRAELIRFVADLRSGGPVGDFSSRLRRRIPSVDRYISTHFRTWRPRPDARFGRAGGDSRSSDLLFLQ